MYTPAPGMYNLGSIFGAQGRYKRGVPPKNKGVVSKMDRDQRKKYDRKSYKDFDVNLLNRRNAK